MTMNVIPAVPAVCLNGKELFLKWFNRHESSVLEGSATGEATMLRDLQNLSRESVKALVDRLIETVKAEDSGRLVTFACNNIDKDIACANVDFVSFNAYPGTIPTTPWTPAQLKAKVEKRSSFGTSRGRTSGCDPSS